MVEMSVVVPAHNVAPWIAEQLDCILRQDVDLEVIVIDDHSTDETYAIAALVAEHDPRVRAVRAETAGGASARNTGTDLASGEFLAFADADDLVPDGAYRALIEAARAADAEVAIGRHLKFSSGATWEPMRTWYDVGQHAVVDVETMPAILANRACWNRVFRADFFRAHRIRFPEVARSNDIVPMVKAAVAARRIVMVPEVSYLYRERPGRSSMTARASSLVGISSYLDQEIAVARMLATSSAAVRRQHSLIVLNADGFVHLEGFLRSSPSRGDVTAVGDKVRTLLAALYSLESGLLRMDRAALWLLMITGRTGVAVRLAEAVAEADRDATITDDLVDAWREVIDIIVSGGTDAAFAIDGWSALSEGPLVLLANRAEHAEDEVLRRAVVAFAPYLREESAGSELLDAVAAALRSGDHTLLRVVSAVRHVAPLVIDDAKPTTNVMSVAGPLPSALPSLPRCSLVLTDSTGHQSTFGVAVEGNRWHSALDARAIRAGRHRVTLRVMLDHISIDLPVVTARMPLPPVEHGTQLQPLADRYDGWRFLVDRLVPASRPVRVVQRARALLRRLVR
ncbi:glycosyltransferase [Curtobacterium sp. 1P10AnD]|uniref:glycosyltransferase family 2 protein n=1 Tax=Curtobacterium sp. 1P10AnD TaxID=3132283 RepID=UPI0039A05A8C